MVSVDDRSLERPRPRGSASPRCGATILHSYLDVTLTNPLRDRQGLTDRSRPSAWGSPRPGKNIGSLTTHWPRRPARADGPVRSGPGWRDRRSTGFRRPAARVRAGGCLTHADTDAILAPDSHLPSQVLRLISGGVDWMALMHDPGGRT